MINSDTNKCFDREGGYNIIKSYTEIHIQSKKKIRRKKKHAKFQTAQIMQGQTRAQRVDDASALKYSMTHVIIKKYTANVLVRLLALPANKIHYPRAPITFWTIPNRVYSWIWREPQTLLPLSTLSRQEGRLSGKLVSSGGLFAVAVVGLAVVIVAVIEAVFSPTEAAGWWMSKHNNDNNDKYHCRDSNWRSKQINKTKVATRMGLTC